MVEGYRKRIGEQRQKGFSRVRHRQPMPSLEKGFYETDIRAFDARVNRLLGEHHQCNYTVEPEIDGLAVEMVYERGTLIVASTIGDGYMGEDVTPNVKTILSVPLTLTQIRDGDPIPELLEVRGEVYMELEAFSELNQERHRKGLWTFASAKQGAEFSLRQLDPRLTAKNPLNVFCHGVGELRGKGFETQMALMIALQEWGFRVNRPYIRQCVQVEEVIEYCHHLEENRSQFPFEMDGAIIKVNLLALQTRLGQKARTPRWALAYKFRPTIGTKKAPNVDVPREPKEPLTPVAHLQSDEIGGENVRLTTSPNPERIEKKDVRKAD